LISFEEAKKRILDTVAAVNEIEEIKVTSSLNRILASDVKASFDVPPHDNSAMDGYAIRHQDISETEEVRLKIIGDLPAGVYFDKEVREKEAVRIMTGAKMPKGADTVIIQEITTQQDNYIIIPPNAAKKGANVRLQGEDISKGNLILQKGTIIRPQEMGMLASMGYSTISVYRKLNIAIVSTGDELVLPGEQLTPGKIYDSNRYSLIGLLTQLGIEIIDLGIVKDDREDLKKKLVEVSYKADAIITSGGVSVGKYDLVKEVVEEIGNVEFWQVKVKPGKPLSFGKIGNSYFFGLPGNPVSVMVTFIKFVKPAILKMAGSKDYDKIILFKAKTKSSISKKYGRLEFARGILRYGKDGWEVTLAGPQGSGILRSMVLANCLVVILPDQKDITAGDEVWVEPLEWYI
jgi:molybdopterin molybdotransferase